MPKPTATLNEYLMLINDLEEGLLELDTEKMGIVFDGLKWKVDGYIELIQYMQERETALKARSKKFADQAKYLKNSVTRIKQRLAYLLESNDTPEINGNTYKVKVRKSMSVAINQECTEDLQMRYPELMRMKQTYEWDKPSIKQVLENDPNMLDFAKIEEKYTIAVRVNK